tara:strand:+ start:5607 stop:5771 length:165 start_codon:yes stop_codon:yes gene_type:complete
MEHQETYMRTIFGFIGITDVEVIYIEGVAFGPEKKAEALAAATERAHSITQKAA